MIEIGGRDGSDMRESSGRQHAQTHNAQDAPEESGREALPPKSTIQGEEMGDPQDEDHKVEAILNRARRFDVGEPHDLPLGFGRLHSHEHDHYNEDDNEDDATQDTGQTTPSQNALLLIHLLFLLPLHPELPRTVHLGSSENSSLAKFAERPTGEVRRILLPETVRKVSDVLVA
jgi:hypothetical protein